MSRNLPPLHTLSVFETAASLRSFTKAAKALKVLQPAVSRQIGLLEADLGTALFIRKKPSLELTAAGQQLYDATRSGLDTIATAAENIRRANRSPQLIINSSIGMTSCWLLARLPGFRRLYPDIDVSLVTRDQDPDFSLENADVVLRFGTGDWPGVVSTLIFNEEIFPVCSPGYLRGKPARLPVESLTAERLLHFDDGYYCWFSWANVLKKYGVSLRQPLDGLVFNSFIVLVQAVLNGEGIALGWSHLMDDYLTAGTMVRPTDIVEKSARGYYCVVRDEARAKPQVALFQKWILATAGAPSADKR